MSESASATSGPKFRIDVNDMVSRIPMVRNFRWYREYRKANSLKHEYRERVSHHAEAKVAATLRKNERNETRSHGGKFLLQNQIKTVKSILLQFMKKPFYLLK